MLHGSVYRGANSGCIECHPDKQESSAIHLSPSEIA
jgi:hypothetical protein